MPPNGQNDLRWCDPVAEAALSDFLHTFDFAKQKRDNDVVQKRLVDQVPTIVSSVAEDLFVENADLRNFRPNQLTFFDDMMTADI